MRILWITNVPFPVASNHLNLKPSHSGGWMFSLGHALSKLEDMSIAVVSVGEVNDLTNFQLDNIDYFILPDKKLTGYPKYLESYWPTIIDTFKPDLIHIHGSEYPRALTCIRMFPDIPYILSIQGFSGPSSRYALAGLSTWQVLKNLTVRDVIMKDSLFHERKQLRAFGMYEQEYFTKIRYALGRTSWDEAHVKTINPNINYIYCGESLRDIFYTHSKWDINKIERHSIFVSQAQRSIKGFHNLLEATAILKNKYPDITIKITGSDITKKSGPFAAIKQKGYVKLVKKLISKYNLEKNLLFLGPLNDINMAKTYQNSHVFCCPSSIENSPNSVGEAQLMGTPTVASYVGGIPNMITHEQNGLLYRFEETEMLAYYIDNIFSNDDLALHLSKNAIATAEIRHDKNQILETNLNIYKQIINSNNLK
jgi:glycosyltransferase involved in cell wall biosynthesis